MMTGEKWEDEPLFTGNASAVMIVISVISSQCKKFEFMIDAIGLDSFGAPQSMKLYIWDQCEDNAAKEHLERTFSIGSVWRISGQIELDEESVVFTDPVYMPYQGRWVERLREIAAAKCA